MSVVGSANLMYSSGTLSKGFERTYSSVYQVETNSRTDGPAVVLNAPGLPTYRAAFPGDGGSYAVKISAKHKRSDSSYLWWHVTVDYSSIAVDEDEPTQNDDPLTKPVEWSGSFVQFQEPVVRDNTNQPVVNTAGDAFVPPPMRDVSYPSIVAVKNYASVNLAFWSSYSDAVNSDTFLGLEPRKVRVRSIEWDERFRGNSTPYYQVRFTFLVRNIDYGDGFQGHDFSIQNVGFREKIGANEPKNIKDAKGNDIAEPALLRSDGQKLDDLANVHYVKHKVYTELPFAALGLPNTTSK